MALLSRYIISVQNHLRLLRRRNAFSLCVRHPLHTLSLTFSKKLSVRMTPFVELQSARAELCV